MLFAAYPFLRLFAAKMADADDERYEDEETTDVDEQSANNHQTETEQTTADDDNQLELQKESADLDTTADSDERFDADASSPALHPPGETVETTDHNTAKEESAERKNSVSKDGEDERFYQPGPAWSNLERYNSLAY